MTIASRLPRLLKTEQEKNSLSVLQLSHLIRASDPNKRGVGRRKLTALLKDQNVSLYPAEYAALDAFLAPRGHGLAEQPLFDRATILHAFASGGAGKFVVGARSRDQRHDISVWDMRALFDLVNHLQQLRPGTHLELIETLSDRRKSHKGFKSLARGEESICCAGSPRSCLTSEFVLAEMFGVRPFSPAKEHNLPFRFEWEDQGQEQRSSFEKVGAASDRTESCAAGGPVFWWRDEEPRRVTEQDAQYDYGVVAAQRRPNGAVWVVAAGLSGPGTYAAATVLIKEAIGSLPRYRKGRKASTLFAGIEAKISTRGGSTNGDRRWVTSSTLLNGGFLVWNPKQQKLAAL